jgi:hypothetical protein
MTIVLLLGLGFAVVRINAHKNAEIVNLLVYIDRIQTNADRDRMAFITVIQELRDRLDVADGHVTHVDLGRREIVIDLTQRQGARPSMKMLIFDSDWPKLSTERPAAWIEVTKVGEQCSTARIIETNNPDQPIRPGDFVYSPFWSPNAPGRFAILGKVDINRDGKDDRDDLKSLIQEAGGVIDFDFPPPDVGKETGTLSPRIDWYVTDSLGCALRDPAKLAERPKQKVEFERRMGEVIKEARLSGIRPMPIVRLLAFLDYEVSTSAGAQPDAVTPSGIFSAIAQSKAGDKPVAQKPRRRANQQAREALVRDERIFLFER